MDLIARASSDAFSTKLLSEFDGEDEKLFVHSFQMYLKHGSDPNAFVINLDDVWQWIGFSRQNNAKRLFVSKFEENIDYIERKLVVELGGISLHLTCRDTQSD